MKKVFDNIPIFLILFLAVSFIFSGSYFINSSSLLTILMSVYLIFLIIKNKKLKISFDINLLTLTLLVFSYLFSNFWSVDSGMAFLGFVKFFPVFLFYLLYCQCHERKDRIIHYLPIFGSCMTIFSFIMMHYPILSEWVSVAGRLAGFFQYPNTYALFMLVCFIISFFEINLKKIDWLPIVNLLIALFGIYMSGSRTVFILTIFVILAILLKTRRKIFYILSVTIVLAIFGLFVVNNFTNLPHIFNISINESTFLGRLLYYYDAIPVILKNPFGLGYYGYYFLQPQIQTGVYSVVNVHNELLQFMLDIGIIPALLLYACIIKSIWINRFNFRNCLVLCVLFLHSLFDFDFQFISVFFVLILFLDIHNIKEFQLQLYKKIAFIIILVVLLPISFFVGLSDYYYMTGNYEKSLNAYNLNTMAKIQLLQTTESTESMEILANSILSSNQHVSIAYSAKARVAFANGNIEEFIKMKVTAIELAPYQYDEYIDYLNSLAYCVHQYLEIGDEESAELCVKRAESIIQMLDELKNKTSFLGWKINDLPKVTLSYENLKLIEDLRGSLNE